MNPRVFPPFSTLSLFVLLLALAACGAGSEQVIGEWTLDSKGRYTRLVLSDDGGVDVYTQAGLAGTGQWSFNGSVLRIEFEGASWSGIYSAGSLSFQSKGRPPTVYRKSEF